MRKKRKNTSMHVILVFSIILLTFFSKSWRDIPKYYKNMVYVSSLNALYYFLCKRHLVWEFIPNGINWFLIRMVHIIIVTPLFVLVFLSKMPSGRFEQITYYLRWITVSFAVEYFIHKKNLILYGHGWNIFWSGFLYVKMYLYSHLFTTRPLFTLFLSLVSTVFFIIKFKVPLKMKHLSSFFEPLVDIFYHTTLQGLLTKKKLF